MEDELNIIEPCCYHKQLRQLIEKVEAADSSRCAHFFSFGDWEVCQLVEYLATAAPGCCITLCLIKAHTSTLRFLAELMERKVALRKGEEPGYLVRQLTLVVQNLDEQPGYSPREEIEALFSVPMKRLYSPLRHRFELVQSRIAFRCLTVANDNHHWVVQGSLHQGQQLGTTQMYTLTSGKEPWYTVKRLIDSNERIYRKQHPYGK